MRRPRARVAALALALLAGAGCAPPPAPGALDRGGLEARYLAALARREAASRSIEAQLEIHPTLAGRRLPAALATLELAAPDRCRLRLAAAGGTALDAVGAGAQLWAWLPGSRSLEDLSACADSAALGDLAALVVRSALALWRPAGPDTAAGGASAIGPTTWRWREGGRMITLAVAADGSPDTVTLERDSSQVRIVYAEWMNARAARLPREYRVSSSAGAGVRCRVSRLHVGGAADSSRFARPGPRDAVPMPGCELWHLVATGAEP